MALPQHRVYLQFGGLPPAKRSEPKLHGSFAQRLTLRKEILFPVEKSPTMCFQRVRGNELSNSEAVPFAGQTGAFRDFPKKTTSSHLFTLYLSCLCITKTVNNCQEKWQQTFYKHRAPTILARSQYRAWLCIRSQGPHHADVSYRTWEKPFWAAKSPGPSPKRLALLPVTRTPFVIKASIKPFRNGSCEVGNCNLSLSPSLSLDMLCTY